MSQTDTERREEYAEAFRQIAARIEVGDVPLPAEGHTALVYVTVEGMDPGEFACMSLNLGADMEVNGRLAEASARFGGVRLIVSALASDVTHLQSVTTTGRVFAEPDAPNKPVALFPAKPREASEMYRGFMLAPAAGGHCVVRGEAHRIVHRAASFDAARSWVAAQAPTMELGDAAA